MRSRARTNARPFVGSHLVGDLTLSSPASLDFYPFLSAFLFFGVAAFSIQDGRERRV